MNGHAVSFLNNAFEDESKYDDDKWEEHKYNDKKNSGGCEEELEKHNIFAEGEWLLLAGI